tara:strand:+ start:3764 stop:4207 length:444 start_codon:yes stop_codon:yes gene_type:complete
MQLKVRNSIDFLGRLCISATFAIAIPPKILRFQDFVDSIALQGINQKLAICLLIGAIFCLIFGVGFLLFRCDTSIGASLLLIFLIPTTIIMHVNPFQVVQVFSNLGLIGGLIILLSRPNSQKKTNPRLYIDKFFVALIKLFKDLISK